MRAATAATASPGWETYCQQPQYMGYTMDGSYAEYAVGFASHVVKVPEGVTRWMPPR